MSGSDNVRTFWLEGWYTLHVAAAHALACVVVAACVTPPATDATRANSKAPNVPRMAEAAEAAGIAADVVR